MFLLNISLYAQHTADIFIQGTSGIGFPKGGGEKYAQSEFTILV